MRILVILIKQLYTAISSLQLLIKAALKSTPSPKQWFQVNSGIALSHALWRDRLPIPQLSEQDPQHAQLLFFDIPNNLIKGADLRWIIANTLTFISIIKL